MSLPLVFVGHLSEPYFERLRMAARGYSHRQGGLNKKRLGDVMKWAEHTGIVGPKSVWTGKNCPVLRTSDQLRRSLKRKLDDIITALRQGAQARMTWL